MDTIRDVFEFHSAAGDWVAVFLDLNAPDTQLPWRTEPVIGWAFVDPAGTGSPVLLPVIGGDSIQWVNDHCGVYLRADMERVDVMSHLRDLANAAATRRIGCGAP